MNPPADPTALHLAAWPGVQRAPFPALDLFTLRGFLDPQQCAALIDLIERDHRPSTIADANGDEAFRTS